MELTFLVYRLLIALGLGLLVGLQRERAASPLAGVRTFPLVTLLGVFCATLAQSFGGGVMAAGFLALAGLIIIGNIAEYRAGNVDPGRTTEVAILLMFGLGAYLVVGPVEVAVAVGALVAILLYLKESLHDVTTKLKEADVKAVMQFAVISLVILPVLPDRFLGPYGVLNLRHIWLMVVLVVGISLVGYVLYKLLTPSAGALVGGLLGGFVSSTATTVTYARRSAASPLSLGVAGVVIMIASTIVLVRLLLEIAVVAPPFLAVAGPPLLTLLTVLGLFSLWLWFRGRKEQDEMPTVDNPCEMKSAMLFGLSYAVVLLGVAAASEHFGTRGLYVAAALSGLTKLDAITLSTSQLVNTGRVDGHTAWRLILVAVMANLFFKGVIVAVLGNKRLLHRVTVFNVVGAMVVITLLLFWP
jgi:uncharacterized membrane protein (DUF4010 family)